MKAGVEKKVQNGGYNLRAGRYIATLSIAGVLPRRKRKKRRKLQKKEEDRLISELEAAEKEIRELGFLDLDIEDEGYRCPECGNIVLEDSDSCPSCGLVFEEGEIEYECPDCGFVIQGITNICPKCGLELESEVKEEVSKEKSEAVIEEKDVGIKPLTNEVVKEGKKEEESFNCPKCGAVIFASTVVCPECEFKLEEDIEVFNCPKCDHIVLADTIICPGCGLNLDE